jgi:AraC-like DNA-binding protein
VIEGASQRPLTVTGFAVNCAIAALGKRNIAALPLLSRAGLAGYDFGEAKVRVPAIAQGEFLEYAAEAIGDAAFGLHLAEQADPREAGLLFYAASSAGTLGETLTLVLRYSHLVNQSLRLNSHSGPESVVLEFDLVGVSRQRVKHNTEFWVATIMKASRGITGREIRPITVAFPHVRNSELREFERVLRCPVEFGARTGRMAFSKETMALPLITHDPHLLETLRPFCDEAARSRHISVGSVRQAVENEVERQLPYGRASAASIGRALALSVRTLSRRLSAEGTTFAEVVDELRHSLALQYLKEPGFTSAQIAWFLGYESPTSFNHAFRRWTGRSPTAARNQKPLPAPA